MRSHLVCKSQVRRCCKEKKEVLTTAEISCKETSLTAALKTVKWEKSDDTEVKSSLHYTSNEGIFDDGSQTTTLTVTGEVNTTVLSHLPLEMMRLKSAQL